MFGRSPASLWRLSTPCFISPYKTNTAPSGCVSSRFVIILTDGMFQFNPATPVQPAPLCSRSQENTACGAAGKKAEMFRNRYSRSVRCAPPLGQKEHSETRLPVGGLAIKASTIQLVEKLGQKILKLLLSYIKIRLNSFQ